MRKSVRMTSRRAEREGKERRQGGVYVGLCAWHTPKFIFIDNALRREGENKNNKNKSLRGQPCVSVR